MSVQEKIKDKKRFSIVARIKSSTHAWRGIGIMLKTTHNAWVHLFFTVVAVYLGWLLRISSIEWVAVVFSIGLVFITESFNTAIEVDINLTSPNYHPYARDTKDIAAGAVLLSVFSAIVVGIIIFLPKMLYLY